MVLAKPVSAYARLVKFNPSILHVQNWLAPVVCERRDYQTRSSRGVSWYISNVSIIFYCSCYIIFCFGCLMGFIIHFYIILGTNLLTGGPAQVAVFLPISEFRRKRISNGVQTEWNLRERDFRNKRDAEDLESTSRNQPGEHEAGGAPTPLGVPSTIVGPSWLHRPTSSSYMYLSTLKTSEGTSKT